MTRESSRSDTAHVVPAAVAVSRRSRVASDPAKPGTGTSARLAGAAGLAALTLAAGGGAPDALLMAGATLVVLAGAAAAFAAAPRPALAFRSNRHG